MQIRDMSLNIAIAGKAGSGKSTAAEWLEQQHAYTRMTLAGKLKELCSLHGHRERWGGVRGHVIDIAPAGAAPRMIDEVAQEILTAFEAVEVVEGKNRTLLQIVGTDIVRARVPNAWLDYLLHRAAGTQRVVVDDVRFRDEFEALRANGWACVLCDLPTEIRQARLEALYGRQLSPSELAHPSERDLDAMPADAWDWIIDASGSIEEEQREVDAMIRGLASGSSDVT